MEKIYTIPVNETFEEQDGCPFCRLFSRLENDELDIILGASMMEPDIRIKTNEQGFCADHYSMMLKRKRMLGIALMLDSHLPVSVSDLCLRLTLRSLSQGLKGCLSSVTRPRQRATILKRLLIPAISVTE